MLIDYILSEIIDEFDETLIVTNKPINFIKSNKIFITKDFKEAWSFRWYFICNEMDQKE